MKANQAFKKDSAEVGVGTLIVFIAMVLVAAVAAAVLINTTGTLQQKAQNTGQDATQEVSSNLKVLNVYGTRTGGAGDIDGIRLNVQLSAGASPMDLEELVIRYSDGTNPAINLAWVAYNGAGNPVANTEFMPNWIRGDAAGAAGDSVMQPGDLVELRFILDDAPTDYRLAVRTPVEVSLIPESGSPISADFKTPSAYGADATITLR